MADQAHETTKAQIPKGKGKAPDAVEDVEMGEDDEEDDEEEEDDLEADPEEEAEDDQEEGMEAIDLNNIVTTGRRTRGKVIDFAKAARETDAMAADEEEEEDDDYEAPDEEMEG